MVDFNKLVRPNILTLEPYRCARDDYKVGILLDANENTHGPALNEVSAVEKGLELNRYPDPHQHELKRNIIRYRNKNGHKDLGTESGDLSVENLCLGVGSDESIDMLLRCVCQPGKDKLMVCPPTYGMYSICATMNDVALEKVPLTYPYFQPDVDAIIAKVRQDSTIKLVYLTSPGNPTAKCLEAEVLLKLVSALSEENVLIVVDEAYIDFTPLVDNKYSPSLCTLVNKYDNLVVMQTLSKAFGLAGIRLGITFSSKQLSYYLNSMKYPYNISSLTSEVAIRATSDEGLAVMRLYVDKIIQQRGKVIEQLEKIPRIGRNIGGLDANFVLVEILNRQGKPCNIAANTLYKNMATDDQVVVRFRGKELNCEGCLRISIGKEDENKVLIERLTKVLDEME